MSNMSYNQLLGTLQRLDELPIGEVKKKLDSMEMKFSDWANLTNERIAGYDTRDFTSNQLRMRDDKVNISYAEYLEVKKRCKSFVEVKGEHSNNAKRTRKVKEDYWQMDGGHTEEELVSLGMPTEEEIRTLEAIERLWNNVRAKYNPAQEIVRVSESTGNILDYGVSADGLEDSIAEIRKNIETFKKSVGYVDKLYTKDAKCEDFENNLLAAMQSGLNGLETLQQSGELSVDEFMQKLSLNPEEVTQFFKGRMQVAAKHADAGPFIMAKEGKGFRLTEDGELEIFDYKLLR